MHNPANDFESLKKLSGREIRQKIRSTEYQGHTAGLGKGLLQVNIVILPKQYALEFACYCVHNPKPCPLISVSEAGNPMLDLLGNDIDIRTDVSAYNIYKDGTLDESVNNIEAYWQDDLVVFALGCSFTFEHAVQSQGISLWHIDNNKTVPMFKTNIETVPAGIFSGSTVVSMRMIAKNQLDLITQISAQYPLAHGKPIHVGCAKSIGIEDINKPDWGDAAPIEDNKVSVFWACGVTPQVALSNAGLPFFVTHKPGHMLITDIDESAEVPIYQSND